MGNMSLTAKYMSFFAFNSICCYQTVTAADGNINKHLRVVLFHVSYKIYSYKVKCKK